MEQMEAIRRGPGRKSKQEKAAEMTSSPEFQSAVNAAVAAAIGPLLTQLEVARATAGTAPQAGDRGMMSELALAIAELTTQGSGKVRVDPAEMQRRAEGKEAMLKLIIEARAEGKVPTYQLRNKTFLNERIIEPMWMGKDRTMHPTEIDFWGVPNEVMVPMNDTAKAIYAQYREWTGTIKGVQGVANQLPPDDEIAITRGGLVVRNGAINATMRAKMMPERPEPFKTGIAYESDEKTSHDYQPMRLNSENGAESGIKKVNVLGTIAEPASQQG